MNDWRKTAIEQERKKLRAVQDKLDRARKDHATAYGLACAAERIASRLMILLDNPPNKK